MRIEKVHDSGASTDDWIGIGLTIGPAHIPMIEPPPPRSANVVAVNGVSVTPHTFEFSEEVFNAFLAVIDAPAEDDDQLNDLKARYARVPPWQQ
ncbi:MAG: hypothetical protein OXP66_16790 [Candidatus Tectomicrobia bacterium]|nr:hypothetical protein [Candidatus Tectomicrobia bacterium]